MTAAHRIILWTSILVVCATTRATAQPCMVANGHLARHSSAEHWNSSDDRGIRVTRVRWRAGDCELLLDARGDFAVRADLTGFTAVDDYVELEERDGDHSRRVRITSSPRGLDYRWSLDGAEGFDVDRERWLADLLLS